MNFSGKATYDSTGLSELVRDVSDVVALISPAETPLLDAIGDPRAPARSTRHAWLEDRLNPNTSAIDAAFGVADSDSAFDVDDGSVFRSGDIVRAEGSAEVMMVVSVSGNTLIVARGYGATTAEAMEDDQVITLIGRSALEGEDAATSLQQARVERFNVTQIFSETVNVSGSMSAVQLVGVNDEFDYQVIQRTRELMRQLEQSVLCGVRPTINPEGNASVRRTMNGLFNMIQGPDAVTHDAEGGVLDEELLNSVVRRCWEKGGHPNAIVVGGHQKRVISEFISSGGQFVPGETSLKQLINVYESDFGVQRIILSRWMPADKLLLLDLDRISVLPLQGRSFQVQELARSGDYRKAQVIGEYTLEAQNTTDGGHALISGLATS